ncbi:MAG: DUF1653 domain-containing protein [Lachnospiraceae bacterium]|nr:DUF1653 domain-containing protein [Lachnospiraceae bacterium]
MREKPVKGEIYRHFKGALYGIITLATHTETYEELVVYCPLEEPEKVFARPLTMFMSEVDKEKYPEVTAVYRFEKVDKEPLQGTAGRRYGPDEELLAHSFHEDRIPALSADKPETVGPASESKEISPATGSGEISPASESKEVSPATGSGEVSPASESKEVSPATGSGEISPDSESREISPALLEFLDADTCEEKLDVLYHIRNQLTDELIDAIAVSMDTEIREGDIWGRYEELRSHLLTTIKYEGSRLR